MNGIDKITQRITQELQQETDALREQAQAQARDILKDYALQAQAVEEDLLRRGEQSAKEREESLGGTTRMEENMARLAVKQEMLDAAFDLALDKLCALGQKEKTDFLVRLVCGAVRTGKETVSFSPQDQKDLGQAVVDQANAQLKDGQLTLAAEPQSIQGGAVLSDGAVECNCSFETILRLARTDLAQDIAKVLFPREE